MIRRSIVASLAVWMMLAGLGASCTTSRELRVEREADSGPRTLGSKRQMISGYTTSDRRFHPFDGFVRSSGDSLHFERNTYPGKGIMESADREIRRMPRDSVISVEGRVLDGTRTTIVVAIVSVPFVAALMAAYIVSEMFPPW